MRIEAGEHAVDRRRDELAGWATGLSGHSRYSHRSYIKVRPAAGTLQRQLLRSIR